MSAELKKAIEDASVMRGMVTRLGKRDGRAYMEVLVPIIGGTGLIFEDEADGHMLRRSLLPFLGREIKYIVTGFDKETDKPICSRKKAQEQRLIEMTPELITQKPLRGVVISTAPYGMYVEAKDVTGLLKNTDYLGHNFPLNKEFEVGDKLEVVCKDISTKGKVQWLPAVKPEPRKIEYDIEEDTVVPCVVTNLHPFESGGTGVFVRILDGPDALCLLPPDMEINRRDRVAVKIVSKEVNAEGQLRVRGKIVRIIS